MAAAAGSTTIPDRASAGSGLLAPFPSHPGAVRPEWIDSNGHLNLAYYVVLFDRATDALWSAIGLGEPYRLATGCGTFAVETHTLYLGELREADATSALSWLVAADGKRLHIAHELRREPGGTVAARQELMFLTVDLSTRRSVPWPGATAAGLHRAVQAHAGTAPDWIGRRVAMPPPKPA